MIHSAFFILAAISNYYRIRNLKPAKEGRWKDQPASKPLFFTASYLYLVVLYGLTAWAQHPIEIDGSLQPYWKTWIEIPAP